MASQPGVIDDLEQLPKAGGAGAALWRAANLWQRLQRDLLEPFRLTPVQFLLLSGLAGLSDRAPVTQAELAAHTGVDGMTTSQQIREMEQKKLVRRGPHPGDRRAVAIALTSPGRQLVNRASPALAKAERTFFGALGADAEAFAGALALLSGEKPRRRVAAVHA
ncbi:MAG: MarR family winged helix-turn-helix transcriptional regulator, partial [Pseudomonadota bacterium]